LIEYIEEFHGTISSSSVHPRVIVKRSLKLNASAVILAHNHPSGVAEASGPDVHITKKLKDILRVIDVTVLDHLIVAGHEVVSMSEQDQL